MKRIFGIAACALLAAQPLAAAEENDSPFDALHLSRSVYMLRSDSPIGNPTTVVSIGKDGTFLVDPNLERVAAGLFPAIEALGGGPVRYATATHYHGDHSENFEYLAENAPGATLFAPHLQRERLASQQVVGGERPIKPSLLPPMTFESSLRLRLNGETIDIETLPSRRGHTDGDAIVYFKEAKVLYVGDYFFLDRFPIVDETGDLEGYLSNIAYMLKAFPADVQVVPGHGRFRPTPMEAPTLATYASWYERIRESIAIVRQQLDDGATVDAIVERGLPDDFAHFSERPRYMPEDRWIRFVAEYYD